MEGDRNYEEGGNRVSTKSQIGADSISSGRCVKKQNASFSREKCMVWKSRRKTQ